MISEINEMIEYISEAYRRFISEGRGYRYASARIFDEYDVFQYDSDAIIEDMITMLAIGELIINNECIFANHIKRLEQTYAKIQLFTENVKGKIAENELNDILLRIRMVGAALKEATITYDNRAE